MINPNEIGSVNPGSPNNVPAINNSQSPAGQTNDGGQTDYKALYEELEQKLGKQGHELGEYREFFNSINPLLEKLDQNPQIVQAIIDGKIDGKLAEAVYAGKVNIEDATIVSQAHQEVKQDLGKEYKATSPDEIAKMVEQKVNEVRREWEESSELKDFENRSQKFIEDTPDFVDHASQIDQWLDEHPNVTDIEVAYYAVKGKLSEQSAKRAADIAAGERAKEFAMNAAGGGVHAQFTPDGQPMVDRLIASRANPNVF